MAFIVENQNATLGAISRCDIITWTLMSPRNRPSIVKIHAIFKQTANNSLHGGQWSCVDVTTIFHFLHTPNLCYKTCSRKSRAYDQRNRRGGKNIFKSVYPCRHPAAAQIPHDVIMLPMMAVLKWQLKNTKLVNIFMRRADTREVSHQYEHDNDNEHVINYFF
jgi:hypothetical protein